MNHDVPHARRPDSGADLPSNPYQHAAWDVALVCLGGHLINDRLRGDPSRNLDQCPTCAATLTNDDRQCGYDPIQYFTGEELKIMVYCNP
jgi:hypothetical protein